jgi:hypothetical protein
VAAPISTLSTDPSRFQVKAIRRLGVFLLNKKMGGQSVQILSSLFVYWRVLSTNQMQIS